MDVAVLPAELQYPTINRVNKNSIRLKNIELSSLLTIYILLKVVGHSKKGKVGFR